MAGWGTRLCLIAKAGREKLDEEENVSLGQEEHSVLLLLPGGILLPRVPVSPMTELSSKEVSDLTPGNLSGGAPAAVFLTLKDTFGESRVLSLFP